LEPEVLPLRSGHQQSRRPRHDVRHDQAGVRAPGRHLCKAGYSDFRLFEEVTEQSFDKVIAVNFKGLTSRSSKSPAATQARLVCNHQCVCGARKGVADNLDGLDLQKAAVVHSCSNPQRRTSSGPRDSLVAYPKPRPDGQRRCSAVSPGEEQGEAVKDILRTNNPSSGWPIRRKIAKLAVYLASDDSAYVVGADFLIDGGVTAISVVGA